MKIVDCHWEKRNLGVKTAEVSIESNEKIDFEEAHNIESKFEYIVIKTPASKFAHYKDLCSIGYSYIETQFTIKKVLKLSDLDQETRFPFDVKPVITNDDVQYVIDKINEGLFTTDRIALDPEFSIAKANTRYSNWLRDEIGNGAKLLDVLYEGKRIGFILLKEDENNVHVILHGIYKDYMGQHLGKALAIAPYLFKQKYNEDIINYETKVSSNNVGIMRILTKAGYYISDVAHVFVKHVRK